VPLHDALSLTSPTICWKARQKFRIPFKNTKKVNMSWLSTAFSRCAALLNSVWVSVKKSLIIGSLVLPRLVESFGIDFPNDEPNAIPALTSQYESNVKGMYVIGALGGYPLIKQATNQGYEAIEYILGHDVKPADHELLAAKLNDLPYDLDVDGVLAMTQERIPVFAGVNALQFRELMLDSTVWVPRKGDVVFKQHDYTNTFFMILEGVVDVEINPQLRIESGVGSFFGEMTDIRQATFCDRLGWSQVCSHRDTAALYDQLDRVH
jgi:hypothetical protein